MRLVGIAKVREILAIRHIGLGDDDGVRLCALNHQAEEANEFVSLRQIHARGATLLPKEGHRIEPEDSHTRIKQLPNNAHKLDHNSWIGKIKVDLIRAEGAPHRLLTRISEDRIEQRRGSRSHNVGDIKVTGGHKEIISAGLHATTEIVEPSRAAGAMVQHQIRHQTVINAQSSDI